MLKPKIRPCPRLEMRWRYSTDEEQARSLGSDMKCSTQSSRTALVAATSNAGPMRATQ